VEYPSLERMPQAAHVTELHDEEAAGDRMTGLVRAKLPKSGFDVVPLVTIGVCQVPLRIHTREVHIQYLRTVLCKGKQ
jgi:hypothetical protein